MKKDIMVSVIIISYKQEKYIREAIDSVLSQKVNFKYELLLADDCSKDGTLEIMKDYEKKYSNIIKVLARPVNLGASNNYLDAVKNCSGKYIAVLEGDDYWIDDSKLQQQVDFLESHDDFVCVAHLQEGRNLNGDKVGVFPHPLKSNMIIDGVVDYLNGKQYSYSSRLIRNNFDNESFFDDIKELLSYDSTVGDVQLCAYYASLGKIYVINKPMMVYRMRKNDGASNFNSTHSISDIEYIYMGINVNLEKFFKYKYSFFKQISKCYTLGIAYDLCKFNFSDIKRFNDLCPKKYKLKCILLFPYNSIKILMNRFIRK